MNSKDNSITSILSQLYIAFQTGSNFRIFFGGLLVIKAIRKVRLNHEIAAPKYLSDELSAVVGIFSSGLFVKPLKQFQVGNCCWR
jgi:hypothetical protein